MNSAPYLFEASWEVCNKVGGIHTVITSKLPYSLAQFSDKYCAMGPFVPDTNSEFKELDLPPHFQSIATALQNRGVVLHYGQWLVECPAPVILLDWSGLIANSTSFKAEWWDQYQLDTLGTDFYDIDQPLFWSLAVGIFAEEFSKSQSNPVIVHGHEWLSAGLFLHLSKYGPHVKTVFTTHATVLGRALSSSSISIYDRIESIDPEIESVAHGVKTKHQLERLAATLATIFTTVSNLTSLECTQFLGRTVDSVVENGIDLDQFPLFDQAASAHHSGRKRLHDFVSAYFFSAYQFDLQQTSYQYTMGRFEIHNKGYDVYLQTLGRINKKLQAERSTKTLVSFFLIPMSAALVRPEVQRQISLYNRIAHSIKIKAEEFQREAYASLWQKDETKHSYKVENSSQLIDQFGSIYPSFSPYSLPNDHPLFVLAGQAGLQNSKEDRVKLVIIPVYMDGYDGIFNIPLYDFIVGFDLGVFPSLYEPWGYTPLESLALGVPAVTSNLSGFGRAIEERFGNNLGAMVLDRLKNSNALEDLLMTNINEPDRQWMLRRIDAYTTAHCFSWDQSYKNYQKAYESTLTTT